MRIEEALASLPIPSSNSTRIIKNLKSPSPRLRRRRHRRVPQSDRRCRLSLSPFPSPFFAVYHQKLEKITAMARGVRLLRGGKLAMSNFIGDGWMWRAINTSALVDEASSPILKSPSTLVSVDLPDIWTPMTDRFSSPSSPNQTVHGQTGAVIDGKTFAAEIESRIADEVRSMKRSIGKFPGLAVISVGQRREGQSYVRNKIRACDDAGLRAVVAELPEFCREDEVMSTLSSFNEDPSFHGVIVQLPLPRHLNDMKILSKIQLEKDVDGLHPLNIGNLAMRGREPLFIPCTAKGCVELLLRSGVEIMGKKAVVIGRSNIVGLPTYLLLQRHHATITLLHAFSKNPEKITREADIVVAAVGVPNLVRKSWLKPGAIVIDVGTNPIEDPSCEHGYSLTGDVCYEEALPVVSAITPVPGGVGPMTVAMLLLNTLESAKRAYRLPT